MNDNFNGLWIPREIWLDENLTNNEVLILSLIIQLCKKDNKCYASNDYISVCLRGISQPTISAAIGKMEELGYINRYNSTHDSSRLICISDKYTYLLKNKSNKKYRKIYEF